MEKMNRAVRNRWIRALRSGKYRKGLSYLKATDEKGKSRYCCLGVLAEIEGQKISDMCDTYPRQKFSVQIGLPKRAQHYLANANDGDLDGDDRAWAVKVGCDHLPMNRPSGFKKIADWIERNL